MRSNQSEPHRRMLIFNKYDSLNKYMRKEISQKYDKIAKRYAIQIYDNFWNNLLEFGPTVREIKKLNLKDKNVLDLGCGTGRYTKVLKNQGANVCGIDNSKGMIKLAKTYLKDVEFKVGDGCNTKYKSSFFDIVFSGLVLEYLDRGKFFKEMKRILKKGGILLFSMHIPYTETGERFKKGEIIFKFENYFKEGKYYKKWPNFNTEMCFIHTTMETTVKEILKNGFEIIDYVDMKPPASSRKKYPKDYDRVTHLPPFAIMKLRKK